MDPNRDEKSCAKVLAVAEGTDTVGSKANFQEAVNKDGECLSTEIANLNLAESAEGESFKKLEGAYKLGLHRVNPDNFSCISTTTNDFELLKRWVTDCFKQNLTPLIVAKYPEGVKDVLKTLFEKDSLLVCHSFADLESFDDKKHTAFIWMDEPIIVVDKKDVLTENGQDKDNENDKPEIPDMHTLSKAESVSNNVKDKCGDKEGELGTIEGNIEEVENDEACGCFLEKYEVISDLMSKSCGVINIPESVPRVLLSSLSFYAALEAWGQVLESDKTKQIGRELNSEEKEAIRKGLAQIMKDTREIRLGIQYIDEDKKFIQNVFGKGKVLSCKLTVYQ